MNELISVIIPVYNTEKYLKKCMASVLGQTYQNLEIILVDDGSSDGSGQMCDEFAREDSRVKVIHKDNGGPSAARNVALDAVRGEYIGFIDSDDWVEPEMYEEMLAAIHDRQADLAMCCTEKIRSDRIFWQDIGRDRVYSGQAALYQLICDKDVTSFSVNKLFHKSLLEGLRYPLDRKAFEDTIFFAQVFTRVNRAVHLNKVFYHYLRRDDSTLGKWDLSMQLKFCVAHQERYEILRATHPELTPVMLRQYKGCLLQGRSDAIATTVSEVRANRNLLRKQIRPFVKAHGKALFADEEMSRARSLKLRMFVSCPVIYWWLYHSLKM